MLLNFTQIDDAPLEEDETNLRAFEGLLKRNDDTLQRIVNTLGLFDDRLERLQTSVMPLYKSTQKYSTIFNSNCHAARGNGNKLTAALLRRGKDD